MKQSFTAILTFLFLLTGSAATIWNGPITSFTKADGGDGSNPIDQDRLTPSVWITRGYNMGLYNAAVESSYTHNQSPSNTEWANGTLENYASLSYTHWEGWALGVNFGPPFTVGVDAVMHIIPDDIYLSVKFTSWSTHSSGGGFSYVRSTPGPAPPSPDVTITNFTVTNGVVSFAYNAGVGLSYVVQRSSDLTSWVSVVTNAVSSSPVLFSESVSGPAQFYRVGRQN